MDLCGVCSCSIESFRDHIVPEFPHVVFEYPDTVFITAVLLFGRDAVFWPGSNEKKESEKMGFRNI